MLTLTWKLTEIIDRGSDYHRVMCFDGDWGDGKKPWRLSFYSNDQLMSTWRQIRASNKRNNVQNIFCYW